MKILYIASGTSMSGGATKSFLAMLREAKNAGIKYEIVCPDDRGLTEYLRKAGEKVHVVHFRHACLPPTWGGLSDKLKWLPRLIHNKWVNHKAKPEITKIAKDMSADLIHENSSVLDVGYHASKKLRIPDVIHIREYGDLDFKMKLPGRDNRLSDPDTYTISITKDIYEYKNQDKTSNGIQIYNGIIRSESIKYDCDKEEFFLYAGRIEPAKGVTELITSYIAYAKKTQNPIPLRIAGKTNYPSYLESEKSRLSAAGISECVDWLGEREDLGFLMSKAMATVVPSRFEALGRVMPEAMACGSLCIARNTGGSKEQMDNGRNLTGGDIAIAYETTDELAGILEEVTECVRNTNPFAEGGKYHAMIMRSQMAVTEYFSEHKFGEKLLNFYSFVVSSYKGGRSGK